MINYYNSCYNFYNRKSGSNSNSQGKDINNLNMLNNITNNDYYNNYVLNSLIDKNKKKPIYEDNNKDIYEIENDSNFVDFIEPNENFKNKTRNSKNKIIFNENNY